MSYEKITMRLKYVITSNNDFAIFTELSEHHAVAQALWGKPVAAGFCQVTGELDTQQVSLKCYGKSNSLQLTSRGEIDEAIINSRIND